MHQVVNPEQSDWTWMSDWRQMSTCSLWCCTGTDFQQVLHVALIYSSVLCILGSSDTSNFWNLYIWLQKVNKHPGFIIFFGHISLLLVADTRETQQLLTLHSATFNFGLWAFLSFFKLPVFIRMILCWIKFIMLFWLVSDLTVFHIFSFGFSVAAVKTLRSKAFALWRASVPWCFSVRKEIWFLSVICMKHLLFGGWVLLLQWPVASWGQSYSKFDSFSCSFWPNQMLQTTAVKSWSAFWQVACKWTKTVNRKSK